MQNNKKGIMVNENKKKIDKRKIKNKKEETGLRF